MKIPQSSLWERHRALFVVALYASFGGVWIVGSDYLVFAVFGNTPLLVHLQTMKGLLFVVVTSILLFFLLYWLYEKQVSSDRHLAQLTRASPVGFYLLRLDNNRLADTWLSESLYRLLGYDSQQDKGLTLWPDIVHPEDRKQLSELWAKIRKNNFAAINGEFRVRHRDGHYLWVRNQVTLLTTQRSGCREYSGSWIDISTIKTAELESHQAVLWMEQMFDTAMDGVCIHDEHWRAIKVNQAFVKLHGVASAADLLGKGPWDWDVNYTDRETFLSVVAKEGLPQGHFTTQWRRYDGGIIDVEISANQVVVNGSKQVLTTCRDITASIDERRQLEAYMLDMKAIVDVSSALRGAENQGQLIDLATAELAKLFTTEDTIAFALLDSAREHFFIHRSTGPWAVHRGKTFPSSGYLGQQILESSGLYCVEDYSAETEFPDHTSGIGPVFFMPLVWDEQVMGMVALGRAKGKGFQGDEMDLLSSIGEIVGIAIHRLQLHEHLQFRLKYSEILRKLNIAAVSSLHIDAVFGVALDELIQHSGVVGAQLYRVDLHLQQLEFIDGREVIRATPAINKFALGNSLAGLAVTHKTKQCMVVAAHEVDSNGIYPSKVDTSQIGHHALPLIGKDGVVGVLEFFTEPDFCAQPEWIEFLDMLARQLVMAIENSDLFLQLEQEHSELLQAYDATLEGWARALALKEKETEEHSHRVVELTLWVAEKMGFSSEQLVHVKRGALLHDIGKIGIPDSILLSPDKLDDSQWEVIRKHPTYAYQLLAPIRYLKPALDIPYCHHERWDGTGYPRNLRGEEIPLEARIFAVVDVYDALTRRRPYKEPWSQAKAIDHIRGERGRHFDPAVVDSFLEIIEG